MKDAVTLYAHGYGDSSVGIPDAYWEIQDIFYSCDFDKEEREHIRKLFGAAFGELGDCAVEITFSDEMKAGE